MKTPESTKKTNPFAAKLDDLKKKLLTETKFSAVYAHFLDVLGDDPKFHAIGKVVKNPMLKRIAATVGKDVTGTGHITNMMLLKVPNYPFVVAGVKPRLFAATDGRFLSTQLSY